MTPLDWEYSDGGREAAGFKGSTRDCVCRAISIIEPRTDYREVYDRLNELASMHERPRKGQRRSAARIGVHKATIRRYIEDEMGWDWTPTMGIGTGCKVHLAKFEIPMDEALIVSVSRHLVAVIDGVVYDTSDPTRSGTRCVYGYWK
jgi:hypothetical protein